MIENQYKRPNQPDVLEVIANLSSNEVFTPPRVVNNVLDLLPKSVWEDPNLRWLDPGAKTGVFPREITKRLMVGLTQIIPDEADRLRHILGEMVFAFAITDMTAMMTRRSLYCSKDARSELSASQLPTKEGNVWYERIEHSYDNKGRCVECGGTKAQLEQPGRDNYAYGFIHAEGRKRITKETNMKFDVIVGNPPYQMDDEGGHRPVPIYNRFVEMAVELNPRYIAMITPSRWMAGGLGLSDYRGRMLNDKRLRALVDFPVASELFVGVEIKGGVSYFFWNRDEEGSCAVSLRRGDMVIGPDERDLGEFDVLVRDNRALPMLRRVLAKKETSFTEIVASVRPFGDKLRSNFRDFKTKSTGAKTELKLYMNEGTTRHERWVNESYVSNNIALSRAWKVFLPKAGSDGGQRLPDAVLGRSLIAGPASVCTETYLAIGPFKSKAAAESAQSYLNTRFARFLISLRKPGQDNVPSTFMWLPQQSWDRTWTDTELYKKYGISKEEQAYIATMVKEMPV